MIRVYVGARERTTGRVLVVGPFASVRDADDCYAHVDAQRHDKRAMCRAPDLATARATFGAAWGVKPDTPACQPAHNRR